MIGRQDAGWRAESHCELTAAGIANQIARIADVLNQALDFLERLLSVMPVLLLLGGSGNVLSLPTLPPSSLAVIS